MPISSAAICAATGLTGLAGGAAVAGCCAQMVGFAVPLISQGQGIRLQKMALQKSPWA